SLSSTSSEFEEDDEEEEKQDENKAGFGFDDSDSYDDGRIVSVYGADEKQSVSPVGENASEDLAVGIWDTRLRHRIPAVIAEWSPGINLSGKSGCI
ncbi:hypothetical protein A2U01_0025051, partial [Trifolium medium]|nr:hypothetical protein [Trifolium medium]